LLICVTADSYGGRRYVLVVFETPNTWKGSLI
jgi:hypothetical protein